MSLPIWHSHFGKNLLLYMLDNTFAILLGAAKRLGLIKPKIISIVMGVVTLDMPFWRRWAILSALKGTHSLAISHGEQDYLHSLSHGKLDCRYLPFGVDAAFWHPNTTAQNLRGHSKNYVLSIGNDRFRDYQTLIKSWKPHFPLLKIITKLPVVHTASNIEIIKGDMWKQALSDDEVRSQMQNALFVIIPIQKTVQPSGQSATLQAMACGKAVILSDTQGLWDRELMVSNETCLLVEPESAETLAKSISELLEHTNIAVEIGARARLVVEKHLNTEIMASTLISLWTESNRGGSE